ncbi:alpha/beta hydrolase [Bradyrhizobium ontarionense]|uniref:Alpha/beta hydrolase n=1 Tax=Bradyrhizobium ontarionense TaxID=2898149 RepID=A0ABY3R7J4_9BRAD|nr:alpha/beta hydrolase [Bradyrhizobium sp. A19]UFZ03301.1 alpha/beta hydrolase [Bradyrhizobium sp. A19]
MLAGGEIQERNGVILRSSHIAIRDTGTLRLLHWSETGPPCLLLHGFADSADVWSEFAPFLAANFCTFAMDLRGHGDSSWNRDSAYQVASFVEDLDAVLQAIDGEPVTLVGHSLGAEIAILFAAASMHRVARLVIVDFGPEIGAAAADRLRAEFVSMPRRFRSVAEYEEWLIERRPLVDRKVLARFASNNLRQVAGGFEIKADPALAERPQFGEPMVRQDRRHDPMLWAALAKVKCPCLVIRGQGSAVLPADVARRMATAVLADGQLAIVNRAGHGVVMENAAGLFEATRGFLLGRGARDKS